MDLKVTVVPNSKKNEVTEVKLGVLEVKLKAKPERNQANELLIKVLSKYFKIPTSAIQIITGHHSRHKRVNISD